MEFQVRNKITYLSFILAVLIVIRHSCSIGIYDNLSTTHYWIEKFISDITDIVVPIFFAVSGFLFYQNFDYSKLRKKLTSRVNSLLIPFIIWNLLGFGFYFLINHIPILVGRTGVTVEFNGIFDFVDLVFLKTKYNITWFIKDLMIFTLLTPIIVPLLSKKVMGGILLIISVFGYYFNSSITLYYVPYVFGSFMAMNFRETVLKKYSIKMRLYSAFCLLITFVLQTTVGLTQGPSVMPLRIFQIILVWICSDILAKDQEPKWWMRISFFIYVSHHIILESTEKLFYLTIGDNTIGAIADHIFAPMITISIIIGIAYLLRTYMPLSWKILNGGRS